MWEAARASSESYFKSAMEKIKALSENAFAALENIDKRKWTCHAFRPRTNCPQLVNNWAEAFNMMILKGRDQPILSVLNYIHTKVMTRLVEQHDEAKKWTGLVCPKVEKLIKHREKLTKNYITTACGNGKYTSFTGNFTFNIDLPKFECSCGMWKLGGVPCVHAVCVFQTHNKDPRRYVHKAFLTTTFAKVYNTFFAPIRGPMDWPIVYLPIILPPHITVMPGRPKNKRNIDPLKLRNKPPKRARANRDPTVYKAKRNGVVMHCAKCGGSGHNKRGCKQGGSTSAS